jgi:hypothetical protein
VTRGGNILSVGDRLDPNGEFPRASTCANRMYLLPSSDFEAARKKSDTQLCVHQPSNKVEKLVIVFLFMRIKSIFCCVGDIPYRNEVRNDVQLSGTD